MRKVDPSAVRDDYVRLNGQLAEVAKLHNVHEWTVWDNLKRHYPEVLRHGFKGEFVPTKEQLETWYWREDRTLKDIATQCGTRESVVWQWMKRNGIPTKGRRSANTTPGAFLPTEEQVRDLYEKQGYGVEKTAEILGTTRHFVIKAMRMFGIETRPTLSVQIATGMTQPMLKAFKSGFYEMADGRRLQYQSSFEETFIRLATEQGLYVDRWMKTSGIPYEFDGRMRRYYPDFLVKRSADDVNVPIVVEVKSENSLANSELTQAKTRAAFHWAQFNNQSYMLATETHLGIYNSHARQSRTKLHEWVEEVERAGDEPFFRFLQRIEESYNSPTKPRLSEWLFGDEDVR